MENHISANEIVDVELLGICGMWWNAGWEWEPVSVGGGSAVEGQPCDPSGSQSSSGGVNIPQWMLNFGFENRHTQSHSDVPQISHVAIENISQNSPAIVETGQNSSAARNNQSATSDNLPGTSVSPPGIGDNPPGTWNSPSTSRDNPLATQKDPSVTSENLLGTGSGPSVSSESPSPRAPRIHLKSSQQSDMSSGTSDTVKCPVRLRASRSTRCDCSNCISRLNGGRESRHNCDLCEKTYGKPSQLLVHFRRHVGLKPFVCSWPQCNMKFTRLYEMQRHFLSHTGEKRHRCEWCGSKFARLDHMKRHLKTHQPRPQV